MSTKIPVTLLTGFLGAGKTTLLNRIINSDHGLRVAILVNDFGAINIDSQLVVDVKGDMVALSNGCICCTIRGDFVQAVRDVVNRDMPPEYIIVEASGVSDPIDVGLTFQSISQVAIDSVVTLIDAEQIRSLGREYEVLAMNQIGVADIVILNKADLVDESQLAEVYRYVRKIIRDARIIESVQANVPLDLILNVGGFDLDRLRDRESDAVHVHEAGAVHHHHHDGLLVFNTWSWTSTEPLRLTALRRFLDQLPAYVYRAKGLFYIEDDPDQEIIAQVVGRRVTISVGNPWGEHEPYSQFVLIAGEGELDTQMLHDGLEASLVKNAPASPLARMSERLFSWRRTY